MREIWSPASLFVVVRWFLTLPWGVGGDVAVRRWMPAAHFVVSSGVVRGPLNYVSAGMVKRWPFYLLLACWFSTEAGDFPSVFQSVCRFQDRAGSVWERRQRQQRHALSPHGRLLRDLFVSFILVGVLCTIGLF